MEFYFVLLLVAAASAGTIYVRPDHDIEHGKVYKYDDELYTVDDDEDDDDHIKLKRITRDADDDDFYTKVYNVKKHDDDDDDDDTKFITLKTVKNTDKHLINVLTEKTLPIVQTQFVKPTVRYVQPTLKYVKPETTQYITLKENYDNFQKHNVAPVLNLNTPKTEKIVFNNQFPVKHDAIEVIAKSTPIIKTNTPVLTVPTTLFKSHNTPIVNTHVVKTPVYKTIDYQNLPYNTYNLQTPVYTTGHIQTPVYNTHAIKNFETPILVNNNKVFKHLNTHVEVPTFKTFNTPVLTHGIDTFNTEFVKTVETPVVYKTVEKLTPGYVAANHGAVHTAPLPEGPSNDGFYASHHINLPDAKKNH